MRFIYPAIIKETEEGFHARFPDLEMCETDGSTIDEVLYRAHDAMENWLTAEFEEDEPNLPPVSDEADLNLAEGEFVRDILVIYRFHVGWDE